MVKQPRQHPGRTHDLTECPHSSILAVTSLTILSLSLSLTFPLLPSESSSTTSSLAFTLESRGIYRGNTTQGKPKMVTASALERRSIPRSLLVPLHSRYTERMRKRRRGEDDTGSFAETIYSSRFFFLDIFFGIISWNVIKNAVERS